MTLSIMNTRDICVAMVAAMIFLILSECSITSMPLSQDFQEETSLQGLWRYPEIQEVCVGQTASANITLHLLQAIINNLTLTNFKVLVGKQEFSHGSLVSGDYHNGDENVNRWMSRISFEGNTMVYEIHNRKVEFRDEFLCHVEIDIGQKNFKTDPFQWFAVDDCIPPNKPSAAEKDTSQLDLVNITEQLDKASASLNALTSEMVKLRKQNSVLHQLLVKVARNTKESLNSSDQLREIHLRLEKIAEELDIQKNSDTLSKMDIAVLVMLSFLALQTLLPSHYMKKVKKESRGLVNLLPFKGDDHASMFVQSSTVHESRNQESSDYSTSQISRNTGSTNYSLVNTTVEETAI